MEPLAGVSGFFLVFCHKSIHGIIPVFIMTNNTVLLRNELLQLAAQIEDDQLLANACLVLRGEADTIIRADETEQLLRRPNASG